MVPNLAEKTYGLKLEKLISAWGVELKLTADLLIKYRGLSLSTVKPTYHEPAPAQDVPPEVS
jgi:hypothetical protein